MMDSFLNNQLDGTLRAGDELEREGLDNAEARVFKNSEGVEYSESDLERIDCVADIMHEIFTDEVISNWENLSVEERAAYLSEYYARAGEALGIDTKGIYVTDLYALYGYGTQGVNSGDGYLGIDIRQVMDPSSLEDLLNTATHEMRHQLQFDALRNPSAFPDIPKETMDQWRYELSPEHYIDGSYDFESYWKQAVETDARAFAEEVVEKYRADGSARRPDGQEAAYAANRMEDGEDAAELLGVKSTPASIRPGEAEAEEFPEASAEKAAVEPETGLAEEDDLNRPTLTYTAAECMKASTGTQNYCLFSGAGRR